MAEWTDLSDGERQQAWFIFDSLRKRGPKTVDEICLTWAIPQKNAIRELSAMQANDMVVRCEETDAPMAWSEIRRRRYQANPHVRQSRYTELLEEWDGNFVDRDSVPMLGYDVDFDANRFVLVEDSTYGNGLYVTVHETPAEAGRYHDSSEYPQDYNIKALIDLDTGDEYDAITDFKTYPAPEQTTDDDRYFIVVLHDEGQLSAISRRTTGDRGPFSGPWALLTEKEADDLAGAWNADDRNMSRAVAVEVYRYDRDPVWTEEYA